MSDIYKIQSIIISPSGWCFSASTASRYSKYLSFESPKKHGNTKHIVSYECKARNINVAWKKFFNLVEEFIEAAAFQTSSYLSFHDWNNIVINKSKNIAVVLIYPRSLNTSLELYNQENVDDVNKIIDIAKNDIKIKNFLHCYKMAILVDAPETQDAYEKYLLLACESLAGEINDGKGYAKVNAVRLKKIIGKTLQKYFFSSINPKVGKTIRNANMHTGKSPNNKPQKTVELVNKLREFIKKEYGLKSLTIIKEQHQPTRGLYRDDGQRIFLSGNGVNNLSLITITDLNDFIKNLPKDIKISTKEEANLLLKI